MNRTFKISTLYNPNSATTDMLYKLITKGFDFIKSRGVSEKHKEHNKLTILLNIIAALTSFGAFGIFVVTILYTDQYAYMGITLSVSITYLTMLIYIISI